ncbi:MAG: argininosuccinate lyase [Oligoflexia bacterium]|nr:argininosuccinate lyase [Oligoflexia bacterium]
MVMLDEAVSSLIVSDTQRALDLEMVPSDIWGTRAHVCMLAECGIIAKPQTQAILKALDQIETRLHAKQFEINPALGTQLTLEREVLELAGEEAGLSMHTARSRNDQVATCEALYLRDQTLSVFELGTALLAILLDKAAQHTTTIFPGYTHMQPGKPTVFAQYILTYHDSLARALDGLRYCLKKYDLCPLGSVESFGTSWPINREKTAKLLGFSAPWEITLDAIAHRGYLQLEILQALSQIGLTLGRISADFLLFSTHEFGFLQLGDSAAQRLHPITGSSVMAQKRNPDVLELVRATAPQILALAHGAAAVLEGLPSGYNRDSRELKEYIAMGLRKIRGALAATTVVLRDIEVNAERTHAAVVENYSLTTDLADCVAQKCGLPYRLVYKIVGQCVDQLMSKKLPLSKLAAGDLEIAAKAKGIELKISQQELTEVLRPESAVARRLHTGAPSAEQLQKQLRSRKSALKQLSDYCTVEQDKVRDAKQATLDLCHAWCR